MEHWSYNDSELGAPTIRSTALVLRDLLCLFFLNALFRQPQITDPTLEFEIRHWKFAEITNAAFMEFIKDLVLATKRYCVYTWSLGFRIATCAVFLD